jgi:hypothetical protein
MAPHSVFIHRIGWGLEGLLSDSSTEDRIHTLCSTRGTGAAA